MRDGQQHHTTILGHVILVIHCHTHKLIWGHTVTEVIAAVLVISNSNYFHLPLRTHLAMNSDWVKKSELLITVRSSLTFEKYSTSSISGLMLLCVTRHQTRKSVMVGGLGTSEANIMGDLDTGGTGCHIQMWFMAIVRNTYALWLHTNIYTLAPQMDISLMRGWISDCWSNVRGQSEVRGYVELNSSLWGVRVI